MGEKRGGTTVAVTSKGQATIPKKFRDKLNIDTPGRVRFIETENGEIFIRPVKRPSELRGALASDEEHDAEEQSATQLLREERERDKQRADENNDLLERPE